MGFQDDWFMRQIQQLAQFIAHTIFHKDIICYEIADEADLSQSDLLYIQIKRLVSDRKICEAENLLFDKLETSDYKYLELAIDFYLSIDKLSDEELESANFSREEIQTGMREVLSQFNIPNLGI